MRSQTKADDITKAHPSWKDKINFVIVSDFTSQQPFDKIFENTKTAAVPFTYVIHTASPMRFDVKDIRKEMLEPAVMGLAYEITFHVLAMVGLIDQHVLEQRRSSRVLTDMPARL